MRKNKYTVYRCVIIVDEKTLEKTNISFMLIELTKSDKFKKFIFSRGSDNPYHEGF
jgi:hypothetical protein